MRAGALRELRAGVAEGALVRHERLGRDAHEGVVQIGVVVRARLEAALETVEEASSADRNPASAARQLPTVHRVLRQGQRNGRADLHAVVIEEGQRDLAAVARRLVRRAHAPAEHDHEILRVQLRGREAGGEQVDRLLGKAERDRTREEVAAAFEGAWIARPGCAAHVHVPAGDAGLEVRVRQQVGLEAGDAGAREALIRERVGGVDGGTRESLPGHEAEDAVVVQGPIHEPRLGPQRIHDRATDRVQVELGDVGLEVEDIGEVLGPVRHAAGAAGVKVVEVAPEAGLTVVGHEDVVAALRPEDVAPHLDVARAVVDADVVALGRVERVADDPHVALAADRDRRLRVAVDQIVGDELAAAGGDADRIPRDAVGLDGAGEIHAGDVRLDEVRLGQIAAAQHARSGHPGGVGEDVLILHRAGEADAGGIAVDVVRQRGPDEPEAPRVADGGDDAGGVVVDAVGAESDRGSVLDADGRPVEIVPLDHGAGRRRWVDENIFRGEQRLDLLRAQGAAEDRDFVEATVDEAHALRLPYRQGRIDVRDGPDIGGRTHGRSVRVDGVRAPAPRQRQLVPLPCRERERDGSEEDGPRRRTVDVEAESAPVVEEDPLVRPAAPLVLRDEHVREARGAAGPDDVEIGPELEAEVVRAKGPRRAVRHLNEVVHAVQAERLTELPGAEGGAALERAVVSVAGVVRVPLAAEPTHEGVDGAARSVERGADCADVVVCDAPAHGSEEHDAGGAPGQMVVPHLDVRRARAGRRHAPRPAGDGVVLDHRVRRPAGQREAGGGAGHLDHVVDDLGTRAAVEGEARPSEGGADQRDVGAAGHAGAGAHDEVRERRARGIGAADGDGALDRADPFRRAEDQHAGVGRGQRVPRVEVVRVEHALDRRLGRGGTEPVVGERPERRRDAVADERRVVDVVLRRHVEHVAAHVDLRGAGREVLPGDERMTVRVHRDRGPLRGAQLADAARARIPGQLLDEGRAVPAPGVQHRRVPGEAGDAVVQPHQLEDAAAGRERRLRGGPAGVRHAAVAGRAKPGRHPRRRQCVETPDEDLEVGAGVVLPGREERSGVVRQARSAAAPRAVADSGGRGGPGELAPGRAAVLAQIDLVVAGDVLRPGDRNLRSVGRDREVRDGGGRRGDAGAARAARPQLDP